MNREIKFRALNEYMEWVYGCIVYDNSTPNDVWIWNKDGGVITGKLGTEGQFTCLHDKNGKEIYEGDIVAIDFGFDEPEKSEVKFISGGFTVEADFGDYDMTTIGWAIDASESIEVIGNIHQNPEMI